MKKYLLVTVLLFILSAVGITEAGQINIVVSIYPLKDMVEQIGGERVEVSFMVPPGASPHTFEPTPSDMIRMQRARMLVMIGAGLEFWSGKAIRGTKGRELRVVTLSEGMPLISGIHAHEKGRDHQGSGADPHLWLDPLLAVEMVDKILWELKEVDPANEAYYRNRAAAFTGRLHALHREITERLRTVTSREMVTFHPAWNYFSKRYGLSVTGVIEEVPGTEPSPRHIARIIKAIRRSGKQVVFVEPQFNSKIAEVIAREAGARVFVLDPIGGPAVKERDTYIGLMRYNLSVIEKALK